MLFLFAEIEDFTPLTNTVLQFSPGTSQQTINVMIVDDIQVEEVEFFSVQASVISQSSTAEMYIAIRDNDSKYRL